MVDATQPQTQPQPQVRVGQRIESEHFRGTIRYLGEVPPTAGEWIGVEWDDKERGKHSGEHNGTKYFECLFPGTGSFTRLTPKIHTGKTFLQILKERYVDDDKGAQKDLYLGSSNVKVDLYDFERIKHKQKKLHLMETVGLANTNVETAAGFEETQKACPNIQDLDLTATLVSTWQDVADICAPLSRLEVLRLNRNRFQPLTESPSFLYAFKNLRCLAINRIYAPWDQIELLEPSMPNLQVLQIGFNMYSELGKTDSTMPVLAQKVKGFVNLEDLHLEGNMLADWNQILRLSHLPKLKSLDLSENKIDNITGPQDENDFKVLESLRLADNLLKNWSSIDQLRLYSALKNFWVENNPIMAESAQEYAAGATPSKFEPRIETIARMVNIQQLNGTEISKKNRLDAEIYYLMHVGLATRDMDPAAVLAIHPRFEELCQVHGRPDTSDEFLKATSDMLRDRLIAVTLVSKDSLEGPVKASVQKKILGTMKVKNLKNLAQKLLRVPALRQELVFLTDDPDYEGVKVNVNMKDDMRQISYYDIKDDLMQATFQVHTSPDDAHLGLEGGSIVIFCGYGEDWGPVSPDRLDFTPCFKFSVLYGAFSILATIAFISRILYLRKRCTLHHLGRTAWIYWPTQIAMGTAAVLSFVNATSRLLHGDGYPAAVFGYFSLGLAWVLAVVLNYNEHRYKIRSSDPILSFYILSITSSLSVLYHGAESGLEANPVISLSTTRTLTAEDIQGQLPGSMKSSTSHDNIDRQWRKNMKSNRSGRQTSLFRTVLQVQAHAMDVGTDQEKSPAYGFLLAGAIFSVTFIGTILQAASKQYSIQLSLQVKSALISMVYRKSLRLSPESRNKSTTGEITNHMSVDADVWSEALLFLSMWISLPVEIFTAMWLLYRLLGWSFLVGILAIAAMAPLQVWRARIYNRMQKNRLSIMDERVRLTTECLSAIKVIKLYCWQSAFKRRILAVRDRELAAMERLGVVYSIMSILFTSSTLIISLFTLSVYATWGGEGLTEGKLTSQTVFVSMTLFAMLRAPIANLAETTSETIRTLVGTRRIEEFLLLEELEESNVVRFSGVSTDPSVPVVIVRDGSFSWEKKEEGEQNASGRPTQQQYTEDIRPLLAEEADTDSSSPPESFKYSLQNINLLLNKGSLNAVVGRVGQGKSSLLSAIIGEMYKLHGLVEMRGRIAYVPQQTWILCCSLRDNVLFGMPFDPIRYYQVIHACGLEPDIAMLPGGDLTEIGERGINLSGGQKQRVSLARAAYADADIYLLDDPLSAVDAHVDRHLWQNLIGSRGLLKGKTRILVTHGIHHLSEVDKIIMMKDGMIASQGSYNDLMAEKAMFYMLFKEYALQKRRNSEDGENSKAAITESSTSTSSFTHLKVRSSSPYDAGIENDEISSNGTLDQGIDTPTAEPPEARVSAAEAGLESGAQAATMLDGKTIVDEDIKEGNVSFEIFLAYVRAISYKYSIIVILLYVLQQASLMGTSLWLKHWIKRSEKALRSGYEDENSPPPSLKAFLSVFALLTSAYVLLCMATIYASFVVARIRASSLLHSDLLSRLFRLPSSFFDTTPLGRIINRISGDMEAIDDRLPWRVSDTLMFSTSVVSSIIIVSISAPLFLVSLPFFMVAVLMIQRKYLHASRAVKRIFHVSKSPIYQHFNETLNGVLSIRAMRYQAQFIEENLTRVDTHTNAHVAYTYCIRWVEVRLQCLSAFAIVVVAIAFVVSHDKVDPATAGLAMSFVLTTTQDISYLVRSYCELQNLLVAVERVCEYTDLPTEAPENLPLPLPLIGSEEVWPPKKGSIVFDHYSTRYRERLGLVLDNVSFDIKAGERVGIVGRTGAGKSSLALALFRMIEAADSHLANGSASSDIVTEAHRSCRGKIEIDGVDISTLGLVDLRQALAIIPQDPVLFAGSVRENLDPFSEHVDQSLWEALERAYLKSYIQQLQGGLSFQVSQNGENFSVGQRSLICLARALLRKTKILVLDEATSAVDVETDELIQQTIRREFQNRTILTIAHRIKTVMDYDKILVMEQGRVVEFGQPEILLQRKEGSLFYKLAKQAGEV
ncbi:hypothetical protein BX616_010659 [Lobosporangium transversale]|nr:hypothetical protein BX616_010659 [Lobosporangium transversale]